MKKTTHLSASFVSFFQHALSHVVAIISSSRGPWTLWLIRRFIRHYHIDLEELVEPNLRAYSTFNKFFVRKLKPSARPINTDPDSIISPADGQISEFGTIRNNQLIQAKGIYYSLEDLLTDQLLACEFKNGSFITIYLSPRDYHRVHLPIPACIHSMRHIPGSLYSVSPKTVIKQPNLFARNERVILNFKANLKPVSIVMVGAVNVSGIETIWTGPIKDHPKNQNSNIDLAPHHIDQETDKGAEIGRFNLGSTVILLFSENSIQWLPSLRTGDKLRMGETIARIITK